MEKAMVSLSFDDGRGDNLAVFQEILIPMGIPATINITTGYVDGSCPASLMPTDKQPISVEDVCSLAANPLVEIALHGDWHLNTEEDIARGRDKLIRWLGLPEDQVFGFASPGSGMVVRGFVESEVPLLKEKIIYLRTSLRIKSRRFLRIMSRKAGRIFRLPLLYRIAYADTLMNSCEDRVVYSIPVMKDTTYSQVKAIVDLAIKRRSAVTLMFHSILEDVSGEDNWSWKKQDFVRLCEHLQKRAEDNTLMIATTKELVQALQG